VAAPRLDAHAWLAWVPWHPPAAAATPPEVMSVADLAVYLQVAPLTLYRLLPTSDIPHARIGGQYRFLRRAIDAWLGAPVPP
jgi:excisionase family DNA binding protein